MGSDVIVGLGVLAAALGVLTALMLWARRRIRQIAERGAPTFREILRDLDADS